MPQARSFPDAMQKILSDLGAAEALPDADPQIVDGIRQQVLGYLQPALAQGQGQMPMDPSQMGQGQMGEPSMGAGMPGPQMMAAAPTRLPAPIPGSGLPDASTIERFLAGTQSQNGATAGP